MLLYVFVIMCVILFYSWFVKEFTDVTPQEIIRFDVPVLVTVATIVALFTF